MKFYLVKNIRTFQLLDPEEHRDAWIFNGFVPMDITPIDQSSSEVSKCALLKAFLENELPASHDELHNLLTFVFRETFWGLIFRLEVPNVNFRDCCLILPRGDVGSGTALSKLADLFEGIRVQLELSLLEAEQDDARVVATIPFKDMTLLENNGTNLFEELVLLPAEYFCSRQNDRDHPTSARVTVTVTIPDDIFNARCGPIKLPLNQKILEDAVLTDVTIVCGDGKEVPVHRNFLAARSSVFLAMFQTDMKESRESIVEIPDMEEKTVRAFLKYLYYDDTKDAEDDYKMALELFKAGHKYAVQCLEDKMKELLLNKPNEQIDIEGALKLFSFARHLIPAEAVLMKKAAKVLERYIDKLQESPEMQQLFRTDHQAALELFQYAYKRN